LREKRRHVTPRALCLAAEKRLATRRGCFIEAPHWGRWSGNGQLINVKRRQFRSHKIRGVSNVSKAIRGSDRELCGIVQAWVKEGPFAVHLEIRDKCVPVRDRAPTGPGVQIDARKPESRRQQRGTATWGQRFAVHEDFGVELPRPPAVENRAQGGNTDA